MSVTLPLKLGTKLIKFLDLSAQYLSIKHEVDDALNRVISDSSFVGGTYV